MLLHVELGREAIALGALGGKALEGLRLFGLREVRPLLESLLLEVLLGEHRLGGDEGGDEGEG